MDTLEWASILKRIELKDAELTTVTLQGEGDNGVKSEDVKVLCRAMEGNTTLTEFEIGRMRDDLVKGGGMAALAENTTLRKLTFFGAVFNKYKIGYDAVAILARNTTLTELTLSSHEVGAAGAAALAANTTLTTLSLHNNKVSAVGAAALAANTTLTSLSLGGNEIGDYGAAALARNTTLRELRLLHSKIGDRGAMALAANTTLSSLNLWYNEIGCAGVEALARNTALTTLSIDLNYHGCNGWHGLSRLAENTTLTKVVLRDYSAYIDSAAYHQFGLQQDLNRDAARALVDACRASPPLDAVAALLQTGVRPYGIYIQTLSDEKDTLLHMAVRMRQSSLVDLLLAHGAAADRNVRNADGVTYRELATSMGVRLSSAYFGKIPPYY